MADKELLNYLRPSGSLPDLIDARSGILVVVGSANGVWNDLEKLTDLPPHEIMGINDMIPYYPGVLNHAATLHPDKMVMWHYYQAMLPRDTPLQTHAHIEHPFIENIWPLTRTGGNSGLFGTLIGLLMGYDIIILAGIPCDGSHRFCDPPWAPHDHTAKDATIQEWVKVKTQVVAFAAKVRSLSGWTKDLLGSP